MDILSIIDEEFGLSIREPERFESIKDRCQAKKDAFLQRWQLCIPIEVVDEQGQEANGIEQFKKELEEL